MKLLSIDRTFVKRIPISCMQVLLSTMYLNHSLLDEKEKKRLTVINKWMRELTSYGVDNFSVKDVFKVCFEETTNDSFAQGLESRIFGYNLEKKMNVKSFDSRGFRQKNVETIVHIFFLVIKFILKWVFISIERLLK